MGATRSRFPPDPVIEAYKKDVDRTLIKALLRLTVEERLLNLMALQAAAAELRRAGREAVRKDDSGQAKVSAMHILIFGWMNDTNNGRPPGGAGASIVYRVST